MGRSRRCSNWMVWPIASLFIRSLLKTDSSMLAGMRRCRDKDQRKSKVTRYTLSRQSTVPTRSRFRSADHRMGIGWSQRCGGHVRLGWHALRDFRRRHVRFGYECRWSRYGPLTGEANATGCRSSGDGQAILRSPDNPFRSVCRCPPRDLGLWISQSVAHHDRS